MAGVFSRPPCLLAKVGVKGAKLPCRSGQRPAPGGELMLQSVPLEMSSHEFIIKHI